MTLKLFFKCFFTVKILSVRFLLTHPVVVYIYWPEQTRVALPPRGTVCPVGDLFHMGGWLNTGVGKLSRLAVWYISSAPSVALCEREGKRRKEKKREEKRRKEKEGGRFRPLFFSPRRSVPDLIFKTSILSLFIYLLFIFRTCMCSVQNLQASRPELSLTDFHCNDCVMITL